MSERLISRAAGREPLRDALPAGTEILAGSPIASAIDLAEFFGVSVGIWEMTEGASRDIEADEIFIVIAGQGEVCFEDGETIGLEAGTIVRLREGERTRWVVTETLRKVYLARSSV